MRELCVDARVLGSSGTGMRTYLTHILPKINEGSFSLKLLVNPSNIESWGALSDYDLIFTDLNYDSPIKEQLAYPFLLPKCDLFWSPHFRVPCFPIRARKRLTTIHDVNPLAFSSSLSPREKIYYNTVIHAAARLSDQIITDSLFSSEELQKYTNVKKEKIHVVPLGVEQKHGSRKQDRDSDKFFLYVGSILPHKNLLGLIKAFRIILQQGYAEYRLFVVGQKFATVEIDALLREEPDLANRISFLGVVEDARLEVLYSTATALVFPSFYEGFGLPPLEAMSLACPIVVSKMASLPEVCGDSAEYVDPYDPHDIARGMMHVMTDSQLREERVERGLQRSRLFSWEKTVEKHMEIIEQMVS